MKKIIIRIFGTIFLSGFILISGCSKRMNLDPGYLEGTVSIGPLCPVETIPPSPGCLPTAETYKAYPLSIWTSNGRIKVAQISPALDGTYTVELAPGNYLVLQDKLRVGPGGSNLPSEISISPRDITRFNINIDTGIR